MVESPINERTQSYYFAEILFHHPLPQYVHEKGILLETPNASVFARYSHRFKERALYWLKQDTDEAAEKLKQASRFLNSIGFREGLRYNVFDGVERIAPRRFGLQEPFHPTLRGLFSLAAPFKGVSPSFLKPEFSALPKIADSIRECRRCSSSLAGESLSEIIDNALSIWQLAEQLRELRP